jgi:hypothetical protein
MLHEQFKLKNAANTVETSASSSKVTNSAKMLQILWKIRGSNSKNVGKTVEMAASISKMLQIARKTGRKNGSKKTPKTEKT